MTNDHEEQDGDASGDEDLDLEKLFESIPKDDPDADTYLEESTLEEAATVPSSGEEGVEDPPPDADDEGQRPGRFDGFIDRMGGSSKGRSKMDTKDRREEIEDLIGRIGAKGSTQSREQEADDESLIDIDPNDLPGEGTTDSGKAESPETESGASRSPDQAPDALEGVSSHSDVLFKANRSGPGEVDVCQPFFSISPLTDQNVLLVSLRQSSEDRLDAFYAGAKESPDNLAVISTNDAVRSTTKAAGGEGGDRRANITVKVVKDPGDLTRLGITISNVLSSWQGNGNQTLVCFDSLSSLLQYADLQRVFRFVHVLQGRLGNVDATTHYHLDPDAHDTQTQATMRSLFDGVIKVSDSGELSLE